MTKRNLWKTIKICGSTYKIFLDRVSPEKKSEDIEGLYGYCDTDQGEIVVDATVSNDLIETTIVHEMLHAIIASHDLERVFATKWKIPLKKYSEFEEDLTTALASPLRAAMKDNGFLSFPSFKRMNVKKRTKKITSQ